MTGIRNIARFVSNLKEKLQNDDPHINVDNQHEEDGRYTKIYVGGSGYAFRMKYGEGTLKDFR